MSNPGDADETPLTSVRQMAEYLAAGCKPRRAVSHRHGAREIRLSPSDLTPPPYLPADGQPGSIRDLLAGLARFGGAPILDGENMIGLKQGGASVSLEPAGQLELSGGPLATLHETRQELQTHFDAGARRMRGPGHGLRPARVPPAGDAGTRCRGCRKAATPSCGATCRWSAASAWT